MPEGLAQETRASRLALISLVDASGRDLVGAQCDVRLPGVLYRQSPGRTCESGIGTVRPEQLPKGKKFSRVSEHKKNSDDTVAVYRSLRTESVPHAAWNLGVSL